MEGIVEATTHVEPAKEERSAPPVAPRESGPVRAAGGAALRVGRPPLRAGSRQDADRWVPCTLMVVVGALLVFALSPRERPPVDQARIEEQEARGSSGAAAGEVQPEREAEPGSSSP